MFLAEKCNFPCKSQVIPTPGPVLSCPYTPFFRTNTGPTDFGGQALHLPSPVGALNSLHWCVGTSQTSRGSRQVHS